MRLATTLMTLSLVASMVLADDPPPATEATPDTSPAAAPVVEPVATPAAEPVAEAPAVPSAPKFVVFLPERVDTEWYWYYYSDQSQHLVQSAVEKALIAAGFDVIDLASIHKLQASGSIDEITSVAGARAAAQDAGAEYAIVGTATAVKASEGSAYGVNVVRSNAEITAKILRVSDGKILDIEEASAQEGGQAARAAGQAALKKAAPGFARKLATAAKRVTAPQP